MHSTKAPSTRIRFCSKTENFSFGLLLRPHLSGENGHRIRIFSKTFSRVEIPENAAFLVYVWADKNNGCFRIRWCQKLFRFPSFKVLVWTRENYSNALRVDPYYFENGRSSFSKISGYVWMGLKICGKFVLKVKERMLIWLGFALPRSSVV